MHILISAVSSAHCPSGICRHAANLASSLTARKDVSRVSLVVGAWQMTYFRQAFRLEGTGVDIQRAKVENNACSRNLWYYQTLPKIALSSGADIVHLSFPAPIVRQRFLCPVICSLHDLYPYDVPANFGSVRVLFNRFFLRSCLKQSDIVVCSSDFTRDRLRHHAPEIPCHKTTRIYQSVSLDPASSRVPTLESLHSHSFLLTVAQHRSNKNLLLLLSAFSALRQGDERHRDLRLLIVGAEGPETKSLHSFVEQHSLGDRVLFRSALPDPELCWLYQHSAAVILPSKVEGFCLPLAEALRCGCNVLCSDIPVLREIGGTDCRYFSLDVPNPITELATSIAAVLNGAEPKRTAARRFATDQIARQYVALYRSLLSGASQPPVDDFSQEDVFSSEKYAV